MLEGSIAVNCPARWIIYITGKAGTLRRAYKMDRRKCIWNLLLEIAGCLVMTDELLWYMYQFDFKLTGACVTCTERNLLYRLVYVLAWMPFMH